MPISLLFLCFGVGVCVQVCLIAQIHAKLQKKLIIPRLLHKTTTRAIQMWYDHTHSPPPTTSRAMMLERVSEREWKKNRFCCFFPCIIFFWWASNCTQIHWKKKGKNMMAFFSVTACCYPVFFWALCVQFVLSSLCDNVCACVCVWVYGDDALATSK